MLTEEIREQTTPPWDLHEARKLFKGAVTRAPSKPSQAYVKAMQRGYVDLSGTSGRWRRTIVKDLAGILKAKRAAYIKDPKGRMDDVDLKLLARKVRDYVADGYKSEADNALGTNHDGAEQESMRLRSIADAIEDQWKLTIVRVMGRTAPGYRVTPNKRLDMIIHRAG